MTENSQNSNLVDKIPNYDTIEILVNDQKEIIFEGIIDPVYINMHYERIVKSAKNYDIVKMIGYHGNKSREVIAEIFISQ